MPYWSNRKKRICLVLAPDNLSETASAPTRRRAWFYVLPMVLAPLLLFILAFRIIPSDWFVARSNSQYLANFGYGATLHNANCQVLLYGDSSAMVGLDPAAIQARTGLSACNIAEFEGMTQVSNALLVDRFLEHNPRPRFIVFMYTPEDLRNPRNWDGVSTFEATSFMVRHERNLHTAWLLATHPGNTFAWAEQGLRMTAQRVRSKPFAPSVYRLRDDTRGQLVMNFPSPADCDSVHRDLPPDPAWIGALRSKYAVAGTTVLIDATPTAPCDVSLPFYQQHLRGVVDNSPYIPIALDSYTDDGRLHANARGSQRLSAMVSDQILAHLAAAAHITPGGGA